MSILVLPFGAETIKIARQERAAVHPLLAPKRLLQLALIALVIVPIPSDDGPFKPHATAVAQAKPAMYLAVKVNR